MKKLLDKLGNFLRDDFVKIFLLPVFFGYLIAFLVLYSIIKVTTSLIRFIL